MKRPHTSQQPDLPLVSVVVPTFGRPDMLDRAVRSVRAQTFSNWELIVVDDNDAASTASTETRRLIDRYRADERIRYLAHGSNQGGSQARNTGILEATGEYIAFLDDDDEWLPSKLSEQSRKLSSLSADYGAVFCGYYVQSSSLQRSHAVPAPQVARPFPRILVDNFIGTTSTLLCRKSVFSEIGLFDTRMPAAQDRELLIRLCRFYRIASVEQPLVTFHWHDGERVTKQLDRKLEAQELLYSRYVDQLESRHRLHASYLIELAKLQHRCGQGDRAARTFRLAWLTDPLRLPALAYSLLCSVDGSLYEWVRKATWKVRRGGAAKASRYR